MICELFAIADAVQEYGGKLVVVGTYDTIVVSEIPATHPMLSIAARLRFPQSEQGSFKINIDVLGPDGRIHLNGPEGQVNIQHRERGSSVINLAVNLMSIQITSCDEYSVRLTVEGREAVRVPLYVVQGNQPG